ncbi:MAG: cupin domain-containing protein [Legionellales bacterium]|nr:cupin domain-containing protein [Legionellales bacterium]
MIKYFMIGILSFLLGNTAFATNHQTNPDEDRGIIPHISQHYYADPSLYHFESMPKEQLTPLTARQYIYGSRSEIVKWYLKKGSIIPTHYHPNEQITWIVSGEVIVYSQGKKFTVKAGDVLVIPPNVPHRFVAIADTIDVDFFAPARQDWIDGSANYLQKQNTH